MDFSFSSEQEELRGYAQQWLAANSASADVRNLMGGELGYDPDGWKAMADMGWQAMAIPEQYGGAGFGFLELFVLLEEQGKALYPSPFFSTVVLAANALLIGGSDAQCQKWLPSIAAGELVATVAHVEPAGSWEVDAIESTATEDDQGWLLNGTKGFVLDGHTAGLLLVAARTEDGIDLFACPGDAAGVSTRPLDTMDQTRRQAEVVFDGVRLPASARLGRPGSGSDTLSGVYDIAAVALAAEQVGGAQKCLDMAVEYAKQRRQFGRPIGSFQAIKHKCADMLVDLEAARSAAYYAAWAISVASPETATVVPLAKAFCSEAFFHCASDNIQIHGGIGFTWEHDAHLYFKRAKSSDLMFGSPALHRRRLAVALGLTT